MQHENQAAARSVAAGEWGQGGSRLKRAERAARLNTRGARRGLPLRASFTLVELMVVITIIAILATITLGVVGGLIGQARDAATRATLSKIQGLLNTRAQAFDRLIKRNGYLTGTTEYQYVNQTYATVMPQVSSQQMLATKILQVKYFPQNTSDLYDQNIAVVGIYAKPSGVPSIYNPPNTTFVNSEILYDFLTQSNVLSDSPVANDTFSPSEVKDLDSDGLPEFVDAWGNRLRFYRWPTRLFRSGGQDANTGALNAISTTDVANVQTLFSTLPVFTGNLINDLARDPLDPLQDCLTIFRPSNNLKIFEGFNLANLGVSMHTPATYYVMLVISAGPDGELGLYEPDDSNPAHFGYLGMKKAQADWSSPNNDPLTDDIVSLSIRAGGK